MTAQTKPQGRFPWQRFIHPRFWPTWAGLGMLRLLSLLPFTIQLGIGRQLGRLAQQLLSRRVNIARTNIRLCFPELSPEQQKQLLRDHFEAIGMGIFETALSWWGSDEQLRSRVEIEGLEHIQHAKAGGSGVLMVTGHFSMMELTGHMLGLFNRTGAMYRPMKNPLMDLLLLRARSRRLGPIFTRDDIRTMTRCLRRGEMVFYAYDQNYGLEHALFIPLFGIPAATITATSRFAAMGKAVVIPYFPRRRADGTYLIKVHPPLEGFATGDDEQDTLRINALLEQAILEAPEQYFWIHRRFKTRPPGEPSLY
ncbi:LpxL/LpxP family Kdo(2)-lipid IV(A) lauroyl/palmitoleoyl acyltransferase [Sedimenticola hydrogenitrophicus]|uniref:LpxL/LpxP family Kdo(2)-lipid IV(A) lauroyl/palmitoleoyl acyltransferase n=1 Tax=Sedimenticola hydrogenitrophicus TaxID=2967975 RepID=UPI0021A3447D|nr:LpxL/LpxP family Kdo(2)-lipid IV(A) lauroyl/palmitoleoyl acyltransferase [Sedimenticola hydrogenitrophicus]